MYYLLDLFRERHKKKISNLEITQARPKPNSRGILRSIDCLLFVFFISNIFIWDGGRGNGDSTEFKIRIIKIPLTSE